MSRYRRHCTAVVLLVSVIASGCSTQARWVDCEGRLEPINRPVPKAKPRPAQTPQAPEASERSAP